MFTYDLCDFQMDTMITSTLGDDDKFCQFLCSTIYSTSCTYFAYDYVQKKCDVYSGERNKAFSYCKRIAGPNTPTLATCQQHDILCKVLLRLLLFYIVLIVRTLDTTLILSYRVSHLPIATTREKSSRVTPRLLLSSYARRCATRPTNVTTSCSIMERETVIPTTAET